MHKLRLDQTHSDPRSLVADLDGSGTTKRNPATQETPSVEAKIPGTPAVLDLTVESKPDATPTVTGPSGKPLEEAQAQAAAKGLDQAAKLTSSEHPAAKRGLEAWVADVERHRRTLPTASCSGRVSAGTSPGGLLKARREALTGLLTEPCRELAKKAQDLGPAQVAQKASSAALRTRSFDKDSLTHEFRPHVRSFCVIDDREGKPLYQKADSFVQQGSERSGQVLPPAVTNFLRVPVGDYGEPLARALCQASLAFTELVREAHLPPGMAAKVDAATAQKVLTTTTYQGRHGVADVVAAGLIEGVTTMAGLIALLTAHRVPGKSLDEVLDATIPLIITMAARAPFGVLVPLTHSGYMPLEPIGFDAQGRPQAPASLNEIIQRTRQEKREVQSRDAKTTSGRDPGDGITETLRGCPVAYAGPARSANGEPELAGGLLELTRQYIEVVKRALREEGA